MIKSFRSPATEDLYHGNNTARSRRLKPIATQALRRLDYLNAAHSIDDLKVPPSMRLHLLTGDLAGFHSISINEQWRIIFRWENGNAFDVEITDYH